MSAMRPLRPRCSRVVAHLRLAFGLLVVRGTLMEVRRVSDENLILRHLREFRAEMTREFAAVNKRFEAVEKRLDNIETRLTNLELTVSGMASHLFMLTAMVKDHDRRIRKLESRPGK